MADNPENVGYKNPPKHSQFKKGQSGNPGGRRRMKSGTLRDEIEILLHKTFTETGKTLKQEVAHALIRKVLLGHEAAMTILLREFE
jgi:hypothetical protein